MSLAVAAASKPFARCYATRAAAQTLRGRLAPRFARTLACACRVGAGVSIAAEIEIHSGIKRKLQGRHLGRRGRAGDENADPQLRPGRAAGGDEGREAAGAPNSSVQVRVTCRPAAAAEGAARLYSMGPRPMFHCRSRPPAAASRSDEDAHAAVAEDRTEAEAAGGPLAVATAAATAAAVELKRRRPRLRRQARRRARLVVGPHRRDGGAPRRALRLSRRRTAGRRRRCRCCSRRRRLRSRRLGAVDPLPQVRGGVLEEDAELNQRPDRTLLRRARANMEV